MILSVTRLRLRSWRFVLSFLRENERVVTQLCAAEGFLGGEVVAKAGLVFWTVSRWTSPRAMARFAHDGAHGAVIPKLAGWCSEASTVTFAVDGERPITPAEIATRLRERGRVVAVDRPSEAQRRGERARPDDQPAGLLRRPLAPRARRPDGRLPYSA